MGNPPPMEMVVSHPGLSEVRIILPAYSGHCLLEAGELVLQLGKVVYQDVQLSGLQAHQLPKFIGLENGT